MLSIGMSAEEIQKSRLAAVDRRYGSSYETDSAVPPA